MSPLVSFLLPAYKGQHLAESIESILNQSFTDFELVIVNDCSPDDIDGIVSRYQDSRIRYYKNNENIGGEDLVKQWNRCLEFAKGEWSIMASDDDVYDLEYLQEMIKLTIKYPKSRVFHCNIFGINDNMTITDIAMPCSQEETILEHIYFRLARGRLHAFQEFMISTTVLRKTGGYTSIPLATYTDLITIINAAGNTPIICSEKYLFYWRNNGLNISSSSKTAYKRIFACEKAYCWLLSYIQTVSSKSIIENAIIKNLDNDIRRYFIESEKHLVNMMNTNEVKRLLHNYKEKKYLLVSKSYLIKNILVRVKNCF